MTHRFLAVVALAAALTACHPPHPQAQPQAAAVDQAAEIKFLADNAKQPGVVTLPSGLQYKVVHSGAADGPHPQPDDAVKVNYEGKLIDGTVFDSSFARGEPADLPLADLIPAWVEALQLMRPGDEWMLYVPPALGYGSEDKGPIPANSVLIFRIQLLGVLKPSAVG